MPLWNESEGMWVKSANKVNKIVRKKRRRCSAEAIPEEVKDKMRTEIPILRPLAMFIKKLQNEPKIQGNKPVACEGKKAVYEILHSKPIARAQKEPITRSPSFQNEILRSGFGKDKATKRFKSPHVCKIALKELERVAGTLSPRRLTREKVCHTPIMLKTPQKRAIHVAPKKFVFSFCARSLQIPHYDQHTEYKVLSTPCRKPQVLLQSKGKYVPLTSSKRMKQRCVTPAKAAHNCLFLQDSLLNQF